MKAQPVEAAKAPSSLPEQSITASLTVEIMNDLDNGQPALLASTHGNQGDLQVVTVAQILSQAAEARKDITRIEQLAAQYEAAAAPKIPSRTWSFTDRETGEPRTITCLQGCTSDHTGDIATPSYTLDVYCWNTDGSTSETLPIDGAGQDEDYRILDTVIAHEPFSDNPARRAPHAVVEVIDEHYIGDLDEHGLQGVIDTFERRLAVMRLRRAELARIRADYFARQAAETGLCPIYPGVCTETGPHDDHASHLHNAVDYGFVHVSDGKPLLYIGGDEFNPADAAAKAAELRAAAAQIEAMASSAKAQA
ncbi:DUF6907 domain-containing protein [Streptomyces sp. NPDC007856]|uniref:DUF6907 domain-containing protein n=1 Tax=Streptomyces sp. NPDC007856 TaxID=3364781 RepID=UPI00368C8F5C